MTKPAPAGRFQPVQTFFASPIAGGVILMICTAIALVWANSAWSKDYEALWITPVSLGFGDAVLKKDLSHWINDGLMVIFFFVVGLEIKREVLTGELTSLKKAMLPVAGAIGGMIVPALLYTALNFGTPEFRGWGVPVATDIAFALGVLSILGNRVPASLKIFLTALAIVDDLGAIVIIAAFYTDHLSLVSLAAAAGIVGLLVIANRLGVKRPVVYVVLGVALWVAFLKSGIHATIAGVVLAMTIPADASSDGGHSLLENMEHAVQPYIAFFIMPVFAIANAGVSLGAGAVVAILHPVSLGILAGLVLGKQLGVTLAAWLSIKLGVASMPEGTSWRELYGVSWLCGIGFTMSLFVAGLAFGTGGELAIAKVGVLAASLVAGIGGWAMLNFGSRRN